MLHSLQTILLGKRLPTIVKATLLLFTASFPAYAGDSVGSALWPPESQYEVMVKEVTCMQLQDCCDVWGPCWNGWDKPIPLPVTTAPAPPAPREGGDK